MNVCNNKMKILLLLLALPLLLEVSADEKCYYFDFDICFGLYPKDSPEKAFKVAYLKNNTAYYLFSSAKDDKMCIKSEEIMRILKPCLCRENYDESLFNFVPSADNPIFDGYFFYCTTGSLSYKTQKPWTISNDDEHVIRTLGKEHDIYILLMKKATEYAENKCEIFKNVDKLCNHVPVLRNDLFTIAALKNNTVSYFSALIINTAGRCYMSILYRCLCRPNYNQPYYFFLPDETFVDYPVMCIAVDVDEKGTTYDQLLNMAGGYACPILNKGCFNVESLQNETFTFAALKNNTVSISSTSIIKTVSHCDMSILSPCLCRSSYDEPHYFFLPDNDTFGNYPAMCIVSNVTNEKYQLGSELEIYDLLMSKNIENMPSSLINPFVNDGDDTKSSCADIYGNPTKDIRSQRTCMISVDFSRVLNIDFMYAGPLLGSSMLDLGESENFNKSDVVSSCYSTTKLSKFHLTNDYLIDWCFLKNTLNEVKVQCCCVDNPSLCSPLKKTAIETKKMFCLSSKYGQVGIQQASDYLLLFPACAVSLKFGPNDSGTDFQFQYGHSETCDSNMKSKVTVEDPAVFCSSNLEMFKKITVIKCCTEGHFCNRKLVPEYDETTRCSRQNRMEQIAMGTSNSTCTHFYDLGIKNFTKILIGFNAEIPDGQPQNINSLKNNAFKYEFVYAKIVQVDHAECRPRYYFTLDEHRPIIQVICEGNKCDEEFFAKIPLTVPSFQCQNLSEPFVKDHKYDAVMENSVGWICYVEIKNDHTIQAGELIDFTNHTNCLETDVFHVDDDHHFCCSNVFNDSQNTTKCTVENLIKKSPDMATKDDPLEEPHSGYYCKIQSISNIPCTKPGCFVSRLPWQSDDDNQIEPAGCKEHAENYIVNDKDNSQMASISLACLLSKRNGCSLLKDVEGNERIVCCCDGKECDKLQRNLPKKVGKLISSFKSQ